MFSVEVHQYVARPPESIFAYISNFENNPVWQGGMDRASFTSEGPLGVGSIYEQEAHFLGRKISTTFEVIAYTPNASITIRSTSGSFPIEVARSVKVQGSGAMVSANVSGEPKGFFKVWSPLMTWMVKRSVTKDYRRLKAILES